MPEAKTCSRPKCKRSRDLNKFGLCGGHGCPTPGCTQSKSSLAIVCEEHEKQSRLNVPKNFFKASDPNGIIIYLNDKTSVAQYNHPGEAGENSLPRTTKTPVQKPQKGAPRIFVIEPAATDLPPGWEEIVAVTKNGTALVGMLLYQNFKENIVQGSDPRPPPAEQASLPSGWTQAFDAENDVYYIDHNSGLMTYDDPRIVPNPRPATSIPGQEIPKPRRESGQVMKQRKFTIKNKATWVITACNKKTFSALSNNLTKPDEIPECVREKVHNRFMDILPNPKTRVALSSLPDDPTSSYYNANYVRGPDQEEKMYIAAMGPKAVNLSHFWRMIWENGVKFIVMSTGLIEGGQSKCERYWPAAVGDPYFNIAGLRILNAGSKVGQGYLRTEIRVDNGTQTRKIIHYWYNTWPDHGVPKDAQKKIFPNDVIEMMRELQGEAKGDVGPLLFHCSAGIGRTGTLIAIDHAMRLLQKGNKVTLIDIIKSLREDRCAMIQHAQQYEFFIEACVQFTNVKNHPLKLNVEPEPDEPTETVTLTDAEREALRKKEKEAAAARAQEAAAKTQTITINTAQIQGELRFDSESVSYGGQTYKFIDSDGTGTMSREAAMQQGMSGDLFDLIDSDKSGGITLDEFIAFQRGTGNENI